MKMTTLIVAIIAGIGLPALFYIHGRTKPDIRFTLSDPLRIGQSETGRIWQQITVKNSGKAVAKGIQIKIESRIDDRRIDKHSEAAEFEVFEKNDRFELVYPELPVGGTFKLTFATNDSNQVKLDGISVSHSTGLGVEAFSERGYKSVLLNLLSVLLPIVWFVIILLTIRWANLDDNVRVNFRTFRRLISMFYEQKNTNLPMIVVVNQNHIRHGGWYGPYNNDMDVASQSFSWNVHATLPHHLYATDGGLDSLHCQTNGDGDACLCRPPKRACSRRLSSFFPGCSMVHGQTVAAIDVHSDRYVLSNRPDHSGFGRHPVSSQRQKDRRGRMVARCGAFDKEQACFRLGIEFGRTDLADSTALGWRTVGIADQHAVASQKRSHVDRIGSTDDRRREAMVSRKTVQRGGRWVLRHIGGKTIGPDHDHLANPTQCRDLRFAEQAQEKRTGSPSQHG